MIEGIKHTDKLRCYHHWTQYSNTLFKHCCGLDKGHSGKHECRFCSAVM